MKKKIIFYVSLLSLNSLIFTVGFGTAYSNPEPQQNTFYKKEPSSRKPRLRDTEASKEELKQLAQGNRPKLLSPEEAKKERQERIKQQAERQKNESSSYNTWTNWLTGGLVVIAIGIFIHDKVK